MNNTHVNITIGDDTVLFHIRQTRAPKDYDGFGTIELATWPATEGRNYERLVLIRDDSLTWQESRYQSGWYPAAVSEFFEMKAITDQLWKRISTPEEKKDWTKRQPTKRMLEEKEAKQ